MIDSSWTDEKLDCLVNCLQEIAALLAENQQIIMTVQATADPMKARIQQDSAAIAAAIQVSTKFNTLEEATIQTVDERELLLQSLAAAIAEFKKSDAQALNINGRRIAELRSSVNQLEEEHTAITQLLSDRKQSSQELRNSTEETLGWIDQKLRQILGE
jgi:uncharacterized phage infection (PIP) family protein YhgE